MNAETITSTIAYRHAAAAGASQGFLIQEGISGNNEAGYKVKFWIQPSIRSTKPRLEFAATVSIRGVREDGMPQVQCLWEGDWAGMGALSLLAK